MSEVDEAVSAFAAAVGEWEVERVGCEWDRTMRMCQKCKAWASAAAMEIDLIRLCPNANTCDQLGVRQ